MADNYQYEEEQEKLAMMKQLYLPMKNWFNALDKSFTVSIFDQQTIQLILIRRTNILISQHFGVI
jgi:hypothetical protein